jgi:hypothetical protein
LIAGELDNLESFKKIKMLSLLGNPVTQKPNYRLYLIAKLPGLKVIDFRKVKPREKAEAREVFGVGKKGAQVTTPFLLCHLITLSWVLWSTMLTQSSPFFFPFLHVVRAAKGEGRVKGLCARPAY